ncbi:MAG: hypothetical protein ABIJ50_11675 [Pseudomonadota bacterium]
MRLAGLLSFLPEEFIPVLLVLGALLLVFGLRNLAMTLFGFCGLLIVLPPVLEAILSQLPEWALYPIMFFAFLSMGAFLISMLVGEKAWIETKGHITAAMLIWIFVFPFRLFRWIFGGLFSSRR